MLGLLAAGAITSAIAAAIAAANNAGSIAAAAMLSTSGSCWKCESESKSSSLSPPLSPADGALRALRDRRVSALRRVLSDSSELANSSTSSLFFVDCERGVFIFLRERGFETYARSTMLKSCEDTPKPDQFVQANANRQGIEALAMSFD